MTTPVPPAAVSAPRSRRVLAVPDAVGAAAVETARAAAVADGRDWVGEHLGVTAEGERVVTHRFTSTQPGYRGWLWAVTLARAPRAKTVTVDEVVLLPGPDALLAPEWVPWSDRLQPGDLGVGDLLPTTEDDERLAPAYAAGDDPAEDEVAWELGLGRVRVLSLVGRDEAAQRWFDGAAGPHAPIAEAAPARCASCGFLVRVAGALRQLFGVCANEFAPDDGRVVSLDHGCGAHSEAVVVPSGPVAVVAVTDDYGYEPVAARLAEGGDAEDLGHS